MHIFAFYSNDCKRWRSLEVMRFCTLIEPHSLSFFRVSVLQKVSLFEFILICMRVFEYFSVYILGTCRLMCMYICVCVCVYVCVSVCVCFYVYEYVCGMRT